MGVSCYDEPSLRLASLCFILGSMLLVNLLVLVFMTAKMLLCGNFSCLVMFYIVFLVSTLLENKVFSSALWCWRCAWMSSVVDLW